MKSVKNFITLAPGIAILLGIVFSMAALFANSPKLRQNPSNQALASVVHNLEMQGVIVENASVKQISPLIVAIALQDSKDSMTNAINIHLARREAALAYRNGMAISGIEFSIPSSPDSRLWWGQSYFGVHDPERERQGFGVTQISSDQTTLNIARQLDSMSKAIHSKQITVKDLSVEGRYDRILNVKAELFGNANVGDCLAAMRREIAEANKADANIALVRVKLFDTDGNLVLDYLWDEELRAELSLAVPGIDLGRPNPQMPIQQ